MTPGVIGRIIDDNYASGASLRNVVKLLIEKGFSANNIICMTPGDMNGASTGGKQGADIPIQDAEGKLANDVVNGRISFDDNGNITKDDTDSEMNTYLKNLSKRLGGKHLTRNKFNDYFNNTDSNFL